jgi:hypothetical protein
MNTESISISLVADEAWLILYRGWVETPAHPEYPQDGGTAEFAVDYEVATVNYLGQAIDKVKRWATDSGFKIGPAHYSGNTITFKLRRP